MDQLQDARKKIDEIDEQMAKLYQKRLDCVQSVIDYKIKNNLPVLDANREHAVIEKNLKYITNPEYESLYVDFMKYVMSASRAYQKKIQSHDTLAYCGVEGAFAHLVSEKLYPNSLKYGVSSFEEVFLKVINKEVEYGIIPFENTNSGLVGEVLDLLLKYPVYIKKVWNQKIDQCLLGCKDACLKDVEVVYSKDQALAQAETFLRQLGVQTIAYPNTAMAAKYVATENDVHKAAIGAKENADLYGLKILATNIEETPSNTTRFLVIGLEPAYDGDRFSLCLTTKHESGALSRILDCIAKANLNMESIQSRPIKGKPFEYFFFIEIDGDAVQASKCIDEIKLNCESVKSLGSYYLEEESK